MVSIVLYRPEIPPNTGNIGRLTLGTGCELVIVGEPEFELSQEAAVKRAGLDYWEQVAPRQFASWEDYDETAPDKRYLVTKFAETPYHQANFEAGDHLIFGGETRGVPDKVHQSGPVEPICLPMKKEIRAYNLANSVAAVLFEALRQTDPEWFDQTPYSNQ